MIAGRRIAAPTKSTGASPRRASGPEARYRRSQQEHGHERRADERDRLPRSSTTSVSALCGWISSGLGGHGCLPIAAEIGPRAEQDDRDLQDRGGVRGADDDPRRARLEPPARERDQHVDERRDDERVRQRPDDEQPLVQTRSAAR